MHDEIAKIRPLSLFPAKERVKKSDVSDRDSRIAEVTAL